MKFLLKFYLILLFLGCGQPSNSAKKIIVENIQQEQNKTEVLTKFNIPKELKRYYRNLKYSNLEELKESLKSIISKYNKIPYNKRHQYLYGLDTDIKNQNNVVLIYSGEKRDAREFHSTRNLHRPQTFNTEHIYPQSVFKVQNNKKAKSDFHHLRVCDRKINSSRGNKPFIDGKGTYKSIKNAWFPGDEWKGDIARMMFYLNIVHKLDLKQVGGVKLFLKWNIEDPVSDFEIQRNNKVQKVQGNRNPFIDNPYLVTLIYGGENAENRW